MATIFVPQPSNEYSALTFLLEHLKNPEWEVFRGAVAFARRSGVKHISKALREFAERGEVNLTIGVSLEGTSRQGLLGLIRCLEGKGKLWVFHNEAGGTFHPKIYLFKNSHSADVLVGSNNLTEGGLYSNYEASLVIKLNLNEPTEAQRLREIEDLLEDWSGKNPNISKPLTQELLDQLVESYYVPDESDVREYGQPSGKSRRANSRKPILFGRERIAKAPPPEPDDEFVEAFTDNLIVDEDLEEIYSDELSDNLAEEDFIVVPPPPVQAQSGNNRVFLMTLKKTDVGIGMTTSGKSKRSPEIFVPLAARDYDVEFWGWPNSFIEDLNRSRKFDRKGVKMRIGTVITEVSMMTWPVKSDFRLRSELLRSAGNVDDILKIERANGEGGFQYYVEIVPQGTTEYDKYLEKCNHEVRNSEKRWGYIT